MLPAWYEHFNWSWWTHGEHRCPLWLQSAIVCISGWWGCWFGKAMLPTCIWLFVCLFDYLCVSVCVSGENEFRDVGLGKQLLSILTMTVCLTFCLSACVCVWWGWALSPEVLVGDQLPATLSVTVWEAGGQILSRGGSPAAAHYDTIHPEPPVITRRKHKQTDKRSRFSMPRERWVSWRFGKNSFSCRNLPTQIQLWRTPQPK